MFDIAALFSVKPAVPGAEVAPANGMPGATETADFEAFANILTSHAAGAAAGPFSTQEPGSALAPPVAAPLPVTATLPESGKILPDALAALPSQALPSPAMPAPMPGVPLPLPAEAQAPAPPVPLAAARPKVAPDASALPGPAPAPALETPKAEALTRLLALGQALKAALADAKPGAKPASDGKPALAAETTKETSSDGETAPALTSLPVEALLMPLPIALPASLAPQPVAAGNEYTPDDAAPSGKAPPAVPQPSAVALPATTGMAALAAANQALFQPQTAALPVARDAAAVPAPLPLLDVAGDPAEAEAAPVSVLPPQAQVAANAPRFRVAAAPAKAAPGQATPARPAADRPAAELSVEPVAAARTVAEVERPVTAHSVLQAAPATGDAQPQSSNAPAAAVQTAAAPQQPHDFVKLVDRLIEARDAAAGQSLPTSVSAAIQHADFGKVSLHFQHDAGGLSVSMASADPDFRPAVQAAMPADRGGMGSDQGQGPSQNLAQNQSGSSSASLGQQDQRGAGSNEQARSAERRDGRAAANPSQSPREEAAKPDRRSGIFA